MNEKRKERTKRRMKEWKTGGWLIGRNEGRKERREEGRKEGRKGEG